MVFDRRVSGFILLSFFLVVTLLAFLQVLLMWIFNALLMSSGGGFRCRRSWGLYMLDAACDSSVVPFLKSPLSCMPSRRIAKGALQMIWKRNDPKPSPTDSNHREGGCVA